MPSTAEPIAELRPASWDDFRFSIDAGPDLGKLCFKMSCAAATLLEGFARSDIESALAALNRDADSLTGITKDGRDHQMLDRKRPPLSHLIYVERAADRTYAIVQFFGAMQFYCSLGAGSSQSHNALIATLDSTTGEETFATIEPLNIPKAVAAGTSFTNAWSLKFAQEITRLGWTVTSVGQINFEPAQVPSK